MNLQDFGVDFALTVEPSGRLNIDLITTRAVRVTLNGEPIPQELGSRQANTFWTSDGKQTNQPPIDLRGEER